MLLNDKLKKISLIEVLILIIISYILISIFNIFGASIEGYWVYFIVIIYFIYKLKDYKEEFANDLANIFSNVSFKLILFVIVLNILFSYGMLYLTNFLITIPFINSILNFSFVIQKASLVVAGGYFAKLFIAPISEELLFRGVLLNKLKLFIPVSFAIFASSLLFGSFHSIGNIISAIVFAYCMCVLYLKTDNILVPIFAHFLNNVFAELIFAIDCNKVLFNDSIVVAIVSILAFISFILIVLFLARELKNIK